MNLSVYTLSGIVSFNTVSHVFNKAKTANLKQKNPPEDGFYVCKVSEDTCNLPRSNDLLKFHI